MSLEGFQLDAVEVSEEIATNIRRPGWHLSVYFDSYAHPDFNTGMMMVHDPVDRAVVVFVGSREESQKVLDSAKKALAQ